MTGRDPGSGKGREPSRAARGVSSPWEYVAAAIGALVVLGTIGLMLYESATRDDSPPDLRVVVDTVMRMPSGGGWLVEVRVANEGGKTAAQVNVEGELKKEGAGPETSDATIDYVPAGSYRTAGLVFSADPTANPPELRVKGYDAP
ncbi:MAG TPA: hypothetical protein VFQ39_03440 [Longimicrobium sp.]|nr:hypothetical protein [Longimicrobium sp.]